MSSYFSLFIFAETQIQSSGRLQHYVIQTDASKVFWEVWKSSQMATVGKVVKYE